MSEGMEGVWWMVAETAKQPFQHRTDDIPTGKGERVLFGVRVSPWSCPRPARMLQPRP